MRYFCVVLAFVAVPLTASAQQHQRPPQPPPSAMGSIGLPLPPIGLPAINYPKPWEWTMPRPAWESPQVPAWERQAAPAWERGRHPSQPIYPDPRYRPSYLNPAVVYVMQPYPVYQPYPVVVEVPAPEPPPTAPVIEAEVAPPPPFVPPTGSRTLYVIPGCYLGNVPPDQSRLRDGCDLSNLKIHPPQSQ